MQPRLRGKAHLEPVVGVVPVVLPFGGSVYTPGKTRGRRSALARAPDREQLQSRTGQADVYVMRLTEADDVIEGFSSKTDFEHVVAVDRKVMMDHKTATRPERELFADLVVLAHPSGGSVCFDDRPRRRESNGKTADPAGD